LREYYPTADENPQSLSRDAGWPQTEIAEERTGEPRTGLIVLWVLAILLFGVGDLLTSSLAFSLGAYEGNPIANYVIQMSGGSIWSLTILKSFILCSLFLMSYKKMEGLAWTIPAMLSLAGAYMLFHNLAVVAMLL
jgi:hypothetical protein